MNVLEVTNENFNNEVILSEKTVLVDFYANWCGPCKMMAPIVEKIAEELEDNVKVCKVNVDENQDLAANYDIMSIPTLIIFQSGKVAKTIIGLQDKETIKNSLQETN